MMRFSPPNFSSPSLWPQGVLEENASHHMIAGFGRSVQGGVPNYPSPYPGDEGDSGLVVPFAKSQCTMASPRLSNSTLPFLTRSRKSTTFKPSPDRIPEDARATLKDDNVDELPSTLSTLYAALVGRLSAGKKVTPVRPQCGCNESDITKICTPLARLRATALGHDKRSLCMNRRPDSDSIDPVEANRE